jgi:O-antigen ligase
MFMVARNLDWDRDRVSRRAQVVLIAAGCGQALAAFWNHFDPAGFSQWVQTSGLVEYRTLAGAAVNNVVVYGILAGQRFVRAGGLFLEPLSLAHFMLVPTGVVIGLLAAGRRVRFLLPLALVCVAGVTFTLTRSAIVAVPVMVLTAVLVGRARERTAVGVLVAVVVLSPLLGALGLGGQLQDAVDPTAARTSGHLFALGRDITLMLSGPLGHGLATGGATGQRFNVVGSVTAESWYFQVGVELGVLGLVLFCALLYQVMAALWRGARLGSPAAIAALCVMSGLAFSSLVLHAFGDMPTSYSAWLLAGLALPAGLAADSKPRTALAGGGQVPSDSPVARQGELDQARTTEVADGPGVPPLGRPGEEVRAARRNHGPSRARG